jgi:hypothetical protein
LLAAGIVGGNLAGVRLREKMGARWVERATGATLVASLGLAIATLIL